MDYAFLFIVASAVLALDQASKYLVRENLAPGEIFRPELWLSQYARLVHLHNRGAAIGILPDFGDIFMVLAALISLAVLLFYARIPHQQWLLRLSMALVLGGAVGNLIDRLHQGYVTDFISLFNIPVFNLADLSVLIGFMLLFLDLWWEERIKSSVRKSTMQSEDKKGKEESGRRLTTSITLKGAQSG